MPSTIGLPLRATTISAGALGVDHGDAVGAHDPLRSGLATASSSESVSSTVRAIRWASTSVSVSDAKTDAVGLQLGAQLVGVLDDAVVHDGDALVGATGAGAR